MAGNTVYQYDTLGRVVKVTYPDAKQVCYTYDAAGNRTQVKRQGTGTCNVASASVTATQSAMMSAGDSGEVQAMSAAPTDSESALGGELSAGADDTVPGN